MKTKKLLKRVRKLLDREARDDGIDRSALENLLQRLARKETKLAAELAAEEDPEERAKLNKKIRLIQAQRKKGAAALEGRE